MTLSVVTWNVENLFPKGQGHPQEEIDQYQAKLELLAGTVTALNPDVIAWQELGAGALADLQGRLPAYAAMHEGVPDGRGIRDPASRSSGNHHLAALRTLERSAIRPHSA